MADLRQHHRTQKQALTDAFASKRPSAAATRLLLRGLARLTDHTLTQLAQLTRLPAEVAVVAVGGYGRGALFPHSDVDVLLLVPQRLEHQQALQERVGEFITACWDCGLEIGSSVRTPAQCAQEAQRDVTIQTAMMESRRVWGPPKLMHHFVQATAEVMDPAVFLRAKTLEMYQRHQKYEDTPYSLEPNCKESPGGLRDLQVLMWIARAAGYGRSWAELAANGVITRFEAQQIERNQATLTTIRAWLHVVANRREDRLVFDLQTQLAERMGLKPQRGQRVSEALMKRYYWAAKAVVQLNEIVMQEVQERIAGSRDVPMRPLTPDFLDRGGLLEVARDDLYRERPSAILETFSIYQRTLGIKGLSARTRRALYNARTLMDGSFRRQPEHRRQFLDILQHAGGGQTHVLRLMNQTSVLGRTLWVFRRIVGQMQHDLFHVYTVDQHILMVVRNVRRFFVPEHAHEYSFCSNLAADFEKPWILVIAALFHDVAKGRGGDHSQLGSVEVRRFCRDHGIAAEDTRLIDFLVREHLTMSRIAQKEDLSDPEVIHAFAKTVRDVRTLTALYLLTVADIRGTSPKVWNGWKGKLLEDLFRATRRALGGAPPGVQAEIESRKGEARSLLALASQLPGTEKPLWDTLEVSYFARHEAADLAWHARVLWRHLQTQQPVVNARASSVGEGLQVLVYSPDRADLFARICGYFDNAGFNILDAKVHTTRSGYALDTFEVVQAHAGSSADVASAHRDLIALVEHQLAAAVCSPEPLPHPARGRLSRRVRSFPITPRVSLRPDERGQRYLLSVSTSDRAGLLYSIARVLAQHRINLELAKVMTLGERVEDTFVVTGDALRHARTQLQIESELLDAAGATRPATA
ncbi:MAG: [protein-PII] uridylyltransferase [Betaproteobacteria bacterium]|nr:[protein-PII] uridylyltransferase [Betaproteobacteria bacterium]NBU48942.1 [protein-PII] uridylyltransferase [Betaproteobacteria bacterium]